MIEDGLEYPVRGEWVSRILIGGLLGLFSFLIIPAVIINGYLIEVLRGTVNENDTPPSFTETGWGTLFVEGLMAFLIILAYSFIPMVLYFLTTWLFIGTGSAIGGNAGAALSGIGMLAFLVIIPFMLVIYYLIPAALTNYAVHDDIHAAFDFQTIKQVVLTSEYFIAMLLPIVVGIGIGVVGLILAITIVGVLLIPFLQFYAQLSIYRIFGEAYKQTAPQLQ